ncbi:MAG: hypothetical protein SFZ23_05025 [Planctomycetota bacterium]|nr:hypothetical protein [Planctomycetota bacterium]
MPDSTSCDSASEYTPAQDDLDAELIFETELSESENVEYGMWKAFDAPNVRPIRRRQRRAAMCAFAFSIVFAVIVVLEVFRHMVEHEDLPAITTLFGCLFIVLWFATNLQQVTARRSMLKKLKLNFKNVPKEARRFRARLSRDAVVWDLGHGEVRVLWSAIDEWHVSRLCCFVKLLDQSWLPLPLRALGSPERPTHQEWLDVIRAWIKLAKANTPPIRPVLHLCSNCGFLSMPSKKCPGCGAERQVGSTILTG